MQTNLYFLGFYAKKIATSLNEMAKLLIAWLPKTASLRSAVRFLLAVRLRSFRLQVAIQ